MTCYADQLVQHTVEVVENVPLARDTYRLRFACPEIARIVVPGQFFMVRIADCLDPLIGRPLALYDTVPSPDGETREIDVVYLVKGKLTRRLAGLGTGQRLDVWGPLGNGFELRETRHLMLVAGGIGQTPFVALAKQYLGQRRYGSSGRNMAPAERVTLCYGARTAAYLAGVEDFQRAGVDVRLCTDDGTVGQRGLVTDLLRDLLEERGPSAAASQLLQIACCGPEPMMEAVAELACRFNVPCQVSLETPMACGVGICFTCVARVRDDSGEWDYRRTCLEGPVFPAERIVWR